MEGWIKLHRKSIESAVFQNSNLWKVWCYCLMRANHKEKNVLFAGDEIRLKPGQFITGRFQGAEDCHLKPGTFRDQIYRLEKLGNIDTHSDNKKTLITVINWGEYQHPESESDTYPDINPTSNRQQPDTDKNVRMREGINSIFDYWNSKEIIRHRKLTDKIKRKINGTLKDYTEEEIKTSIDNYSIILTSDEFYWTHKWTLIEFLQRGFERFLDFETAADNFRQKNIISNNGYNPKQEITELVI